MHSDHVVELIGNRYELLEKLGEGGMGVVFKALDRLTGQHVALKRVTALTDTADLESASSAVEFRLALAREFRVLATLRHPRIINVLDYGFDDQHQPFIAMELLSEAHNLLLAAYEEPIDRKVQLLIHVLQALAYLHRRGILHRDLKPGNVLVTEDGQLKVLDFGLAVKSEELEDSEELAGTLNYMAPEIFQGLPVSEASDLYAVGVMAYEILVGRHPFYEYLDRIDRLMQAVVGIEPDLSPLLLWEDRTAHNQETVLPVQDNFANFADEDTFVAPDPNDLRQAIDLDAQTFIAQQKTEFIDDLFSGDDPALLSGPDDATEVYDKRDYEPDVPASDYPFKTEIDPNIVYSQTWENIERVSRIDEDDIVEHVTVSSVIDKLLAKSPEYRYAYAYDAIDDLAAAFGQPVPEESAAIRESFLQAAEFVGRERELEQLNTALNAILDNALPHGSIWLVGGESGVGKSRLLDELRTRALVQGVMVLRGQAVLGGGAPYQLWREPLRRLSLATTLDDVDASILKDIVPDISLLLQRPVADAPEVETNAYMQRLIGTIVSLFQRRTEPVLLLVEDLQWTAESLEVLKVLKEIIGGTPLLVVGSFRSEEQPNLPDALPGVPVLRLDRLTEEQIAELSVSMLGEAGSREEVQTLLQRETEGNVYFLVEVVRVLAEEAGRLTDVGRITLPETVFAGGVQQVVQRRLDRVPKDDQVLLQLAAVAGRELDLKLINALVDNRIYADLPETNVDDWLITCVNSGVLEVLENEWQFSHDKLRQVALRSISDDDKPEMHRAVATAIEQIYADLPQEYPVLAQHWRDAGDAQKELHYARKAGAEALHTSIFAEAVGYFERALELLGAQDHVDNSEIEAELLIQLGEALENQGDYSNALECLQQGLTLSEKIGNQVRACHALNVMGDVAWRQGDYDTAIDYCEQSLEIGRRVDYQLGVARAFNRIGMIRASQGEYDTAVDYLKQSLELEQQDDHKPGVATVVNNLGTIAFAQGDYDSARQYFQQALELTRASGERRKIATALLNLGAIAGEQGDYPQAIEHFEETLAICKTIGLRRGVGIALRNLGGIAEYQHDYISAERYYEESLQLSRTLGVRQDVAATLAKLGHIARLQGDTSHAYSVYREALQIASDIDAIPIILEIITGFAGIADDPQVGLSWLGLALNHPAIYENIRTEAEPILERLRSSIDLREADEAFETGQALELEAVISEILQG